MEVTTLTLKWTKCQGGVWCKLATVNLNHEHFENMHGAYIIWHGGTTAATVYVGQGFVRDRLLAHRSEQRIQQYAGLGLYVTWASVPQDHRLGAVRYLTDTL